MKIFLSSVKFLSIFLLLTCISDKSRSLSSQDFIDSRSANSKNDLQFFNNLWNQVVGSECKSEFPFIENDKTYNVVFKDEITGHKITDDGKKRIIHIGKGLLEEKWIKKFLIDSKCHPYTSGKKTIRLKEIQKQAIESAQINIKTNKQWLYVAPTGSGKTEVIKAVLEEDLKKNEKNKKNLSILVVDTLLLRDQLYEDIKYLDINYLENTNLKNQDKYNIVLWGSDKESATLIQNLDIKNKTILITTAQSLVLDRVWNNESVDYLKNNLALFYYDEAHHAFEGNKRTNLIDIIISKTNAIQRYFTATPTQELLNKMAGKSFFAYLDNPKDFLSKGERKVTDIVEQLKIAIDEGELAPFFDFYLIQSSGEEVSLQEIYKNLKEKKIFFEEKNKGFFSLPTVKEAKDLNTIVKEAQNLNTIVDYPVLTGEDKIKKRNNLLTEFSKGKFSFLITCKLLNEGINIPNMNTFIDLNGLSLTEASFRSFFQKLGRVLRVYPGKDNVTVASFLSVDDPDFLEWFEFIDELKQESFGIKSYDSTKESKEKNEGETRKNKFKEDLDVTYKVMLEKKSFFQQFDKNLLITFSNLLTNNQKSFTDFMTMKGLNYDINRNSQIFFMIYFLNKFNVNPKNLINQNLFDLLTALKKQDFVSSKGGPNQATNRIFSVFLEICKIKKDKEMNCNTSTGMQTFFEKYIKLDTTLSGSYVALIEDYRDDMDGFILSKDSKKSISQDANEFLREYFQYKWDIRDKYEYKELSDAISTLLLKDFNNLKYNKSSQLRLYNVFLQACKGAKDPKGKKYDCNEQGSIEQFFEDHIKFDTELPGSYVSLIERYREDMDNFMVSKGSNETINKDTKNFLEAYFEYKWAIHRKDKYKELRCVISNLFLQDLKNLKYHKSSQLRLYNVFLQACKVAKDSKGKKYDCNKQGSIKQFFEDHIKFDTALSGNYVSLIEDYRDDMKSFMAPNGTNESIRKDTKTFLEAYFQYKWFIQDKDEYTELRDAISVLYSKDFNNLKHNKTSEIRLYNAFLQACKNAKDPKDKKYDCNEQGSIKQFFEDHIKFKK